MVSALCKARKNHVGGSIELEVCENGFNNMFQTYHLIHMIILFSFVSEWCWRGFSSFHRTSDFPILFFLPILIHIFSLDFLSFPFWLCTQFDYPISTAQTVIAATNDCLFGTTKCFKLKNFSKLSCHLLTARSTLSCCACHWSYFNGVTSDIVTNKQCSTSFCKQSRLYLLRKHAFRVK